MQKKHSTYITPSLLDSFMNGYDWVGMVKREPKEVTDRMQMGIDFEQAVINGEFEELNEFVDGALYQQFCYGQVGKFTLLGFADLVKYDLIIDLKFKSSYEMGDYYNSNQRLIYPALLGIDKFAYVVGTGSNPHEPTGIYWEHYVRDDKLLLERLYDLDRAIDTFGLREIYNQNYSTTRYEKEIGEFYENYIR